MALLSRLESRRALPGGTEVTRFIAIRHIYSSRVVSAVIGLSGIPPASTEKEVIAKEDRIKR